MQRFARSKLWSESILISLLGSLSLFLFMFLWSSLLFNFESSFFDQFFLQFLHLVMKLLRWVGVLIISLDATIQCDVCYFYILRCDLWLHVMDLNVKSIWKQARLRKSMGLVSCNIFFPMLIVNDIKIGPLIYENVKIQDPKLVKQYNEKMGTLCICILSTTPKPELFGSCLVKPVFRLFFHRWVQVGNARALWLVLPWSWIISSTFVILDKFNLVMLNLIPFFSVVFIFLKDVVWFYRTCLCVTLASCFMFSSFLFVFRFPLVYIP